LNWAREIQALSQTGLHFAENEYQRERFQRLSEISAEILGTYTNLDAEYMLKIFDNQIGYATPRIDVRGAAFQDGNLLLVRERIDGGWTMPGGWADVGDVPSIAVEYSCVTYSAGNHDPVLRPPRWPSSPKMKFLKSCLASAPGSDTLRMHSWPCLKIARQYLIRN
jgi:hypothetical protein